MIKITTEEQGEIMIMHLDGKLFLEALPNLTKKWDSMVRKEPRIIAINCKNLYSIDSSSIGTLVKFFNETMSKKIQLVFFDLNPSIRKLFRTTHLENFFSITTGEQFRKKYAARSVEKVG